MTDITLSSFAGGEISKAFWGRSDLDAYYASSRMLENVIASETGSAIGRGGSYYVFKAKDDDNPSLLLPFQFNEEQAYIIEFGDGSIRIFKDRGIVLEDDLTITGITQANPGVVTVNHSLTKGRTVYISGVGGMTQLNGNFYKVDHVLGSAKNISDIDRSSPARITFASSHGFVGGDRVFIESVGGMTEVNDRTFELLDIVDIEASITAITKANPAVVTTSAAHGLSNGDIVYLSGVGGMSQVNNLRFTVAGVTSTTFQLSGINSSAYTTYTSGGLVERVQENDFLLYGENALLHGAYTSGGTGKLVSETSFKLQDLTGTNLNTSAYGAYTSGGTINAIHEIDSPYSAADLFDANGVPLIQWAQSNDFIFLAHPDFPPMQLTRSGHANWAISEFPNDEGPFLEENGTAITIYVDSGDSKAVGSVVHLNASAPIFTEDHVGAHWMLRLPDTSFATPWTTATAYSLNDEVLSNDLFYRCTDAGTSGTEAPSHDIGQAWDGPATGTNAKWLYIHNGRGIVVITEFVTPQRVIGTVISELPAGVYSSSNATGRWNEGAWSYEQGFPRAVELHEGRLCWGGTEQEPLGMDFSSTESLFNYNPIELNGVVARQTAFRRLIDSGNPIRWMKTTEKGLLVGTLGGEWIVAAEGITQAFGPDTAVARQFSANGCAPLQPVRGGNSVLYAQRSRRVVRDLQFTIDTQSFASTDKNLKANHILLQGVKSMAFTEEPHKVVWCLLGDGSFAGLTYNNETSAKVSAWHKHALAGDDAIEVESIAVIPSPTEDVDDLWMCVKREIDGETVRYIEYLRRPADLGDDMADINYLDCALTYDGSPATSFSGLGHLAGETIDVLADGVLIEGQTVSATGTLTLATAASVVHFGYYDWRVIETINLEVVNEKVNTKMMKKKIVLAQLDMVESYGAYVGTNSDDMDRIDFDVETGEETPTAFTGAIYENVNDTAELVKYLRIEQRTPHPFFVNSISARVELSDD
jgi:hypothetical protein